MTDTTRWSWGEMLETFRGLGGTADNLRPGEANDGTGPDGPGLFALDPAADVRIHVPPKLMVPAADVRLVDGALRVTAESAVEPAVRDFFDRFHASFGFGAGTADRIRRFLTSLHALPAELRDHIAPSLPPELVLDSAPTDEDVLQRYLRSRSVTFGGVAMLPGLPELIRHAPEPNSFDMRQGLNHAGRFDGEVRVRRGRIDSWDDFFVSGAVTEQITAFSIPLECRTRSGRVLRIAKRTGSTHLVEGVPVPRTDPQPDALTFAFALLGHRKAPAMPREVWALAAQGHDIGDADEAFDLVAHINRLWFIELLRRLDQYQGPLIGPLRAAAYQQMTTLSHAIGRAIRARPVG